MATIRKLPSGSWQALVRRKGEAITTKAFKYNPMILKALSGCDPNVPVVKTDDLGAEKRHAVNQVAIHDFAQLMSLKYKILIIVEGISCKNMIGY